jgi:hypothetical protein
VGVEVLVVDSVTWGYLDPPQSSEVHAVNERASAAT